VAPWPASVDSTEGGSGVSTEIIVGVYAAPLGVIERVERFPSELYGTVLAHIHAFHRRYVPIGNTGHGDYISTGITTVIRDAVCIRIRRIDEATGIKILVKGSLATGQIPIAYSGRYVAHVIERACVTVEDCSWRATFEDAQSVHLPSLGNDAAQAIQISPERKLVRGAYHCAVTVVGVREPVSPVPVPLPADGAHIRVTLGVEELVLLLR
jgi:hypothetical protein